MLPFLGNVRKLTIEANFFLFLWHSPVLAVQCCMIHTNVDVPACVRECVCVSFNQVEVALHIFIAIHYFILHSIIYMSFTIICYVRLIIQLI